jgi:hypothetical protein
MEKIGSLFALAVDIIQQNLVFESISDVRNWLHHDKTRDMAYPGQQKILVAIIYNLAADYYIRDTYSIHIYKSLPYLRLIWCHILLIHYSC